MAKTTHINKSEIMKQAHAHARAYRSTYPELTYRELLSRGLYTYWEEAKKSVEDRIAELNNQIYLLQMKSFRYDISTQRQSLQAEISALQEAA